jgi:probable rRNA maturation factor
MIDVTNETDAEIDAPRFVDLGEFVLRRLKVSDEADLGVLFVDEATMTDLHVTWMDEEGPTDVLSFPMDELRPGTDEERTPAGLLGDVVVCPSIAARQASEAGHPVEHELYLLVIHGILHLLGYDHAEPTEEAEMFALQQGILSDFLAAHP